MNRVFCALIAVGVVAGLTLPAEAAEPRKHKRVKPYSTVDRSKKAWRESFSTGRQPEYLADKLPFGSQIWWEQMLREDRVQN